MSGRRFTRWVLPLLMLGVLLLLLLQRLQEKRRVSPLLYLLTGCAAITGCLCSTMGALLLCLAWSRRRRT